MASSTDDTRHSRRRSHRERVRTAGESRHTGSAAARQSPARKRRAAAAVAAAARHQESAADGLEDLQPERALSSADVFDVSPVGCGIAVRAAREFPHAWRILGGWRDRYGLATRHLPECRRGDEQQRGCGEKVATVVHVHFAVSTATGLPFADSPAERRAASGETSSSQIHLNDLHERGTGPSERSGGGSVPTHPAPVVRAVAVGKFLYRNGLAANHRVPFRQSRGEAAFQVCLRQGAIADGYQRPVGI